MRIRRLLFAVCLATACFAQGKFELQPFAGIRFGGNLRTGDNDPSPIALQTSAAAGASFTYNPIPSFGLEFMWTTQQTKGETPTQSSTLRLNQYLCNLNYNFRPGNKEAREFIPFIFAGFGATRIGGGGVGSTKFSYAFGGGFRHFFSKHFGWRVQARYVPIFLYSTPLPDSACSGFPAYSYACSDSKQHDANQGDVTVGFVFRF